MAATSLARSTYSQALKEISALYVSAGKALVNMYWQIGKRIVAEAGPCGSRTGFQ